MMMLMPILMAGILYLVTKQWQSVLFAALSPLMMVGGWWEQRRQGRTVDKASIAAFRTDLESLEKAIVEIQNTASYEMNDFQRITLGERHIGKRRARHDRAVALDRNLFDVESQRRDEVGDAAFAHLSGFAV